MSTSAPLRVNRPIPRAFAIYGSALRLISSVAPDTGSRLAAEMFMTPRRFRTPERERAYLAGATPFHIHLGVETRVHGWSWGDGPVVILSHGWEGRGSQMGAFVAPLVRAGFRVVAYDAPGHGASSGKRSSLPHFTWSLRGVVAKFGRPHAVIAHSFGCAATTLAIRDGLSVSRLAFLSPPINVGDYTRQFGMMFGLSDGLVDGLRRRIEERFARTWNDYSLRETAPGMSTPLLVVHDRHDDELDWGNAVELANLWPGAQLVTTEGLGHRRILRSEAVIETVKNFVIS